MKTSKLPQRLSVVGTSGSGKSTLAQKISELLRIPRFELDALHWGPRWVGIPTDELRRRVEEKVQAPAWVIDGNYGKVRPAVWAKADTVVWLDYPFRTVFRRALTRTLKRIATREKLWAGNTETVRLAFFAKDSILWWVITTYGKNKRLYPELFALPENAHLRVVRLSSPREADAYLAALARDSQNFLKPAMPP